MKVLLVNTYDRGGAANSCKRLYQGFLSNNIDSKILYKKANKPDIKLSIVKPPFKDRVIRKLNWFLTKIAVKRITDKRDKQKKFLAKRLIGLEMFSFPNSGIDITTSKFYKDADLINLHWVSNFLDFESFFKKNLKPVVWTLHDMNPFTGGEHYEEEFFGISDSGYPVRRKYSEEELYVIKENVECKKKALGVVGNLTLVAPSKWLAEEARKSEIFKGKKIYHIPYGLDQNVFSPKNKFTSRNKFDIPGDKKVLLFVADSIGNNRKGFIFLTKALEKLNRNDVVLCAVGRYSDQFVNSHFLELGEIKDEEEMSYAYSAADVFIIPSLMDNLPNTVLESLMCGTPVIGFPVGGIPEMIEEKVNGLLTKEISVSSLSTTINGFLDSMETFDRTRIRKGAVKKYGLQVQANNYIRLFQEIMNKAKLNE